MKINTAELAGPALDWAVAKCQNIDTRHNFAVETMNHEAGMSQWFFCYANDEDHALEQAQNAYPDHDTQWVEPLEPYRPSTDWCQSGLIVEQEGICLECLFDSGSWAAWTPAPERESGESIGHGPTPLVAAMRCFVASKLGDEIVIPGDLS